MAPVAPGRERVSIFDRRGAGSERGRGGKRGGAAYGQSSAQRGGRGDDSGQSGPQLFNRISMLRVHEEAFSKRDLVVNPAFFPGVCVGDVVAIKPVPDGDGREAVSPRGSLEGDQAAAAAAGAAMAPSSGAAMSDAADSHTGDSSGSAKPKSQTPGASRQSTPALGTGSSAPVSEDNSDVAGGADRGRQGPPSPRSANGLAKGPAKGPANGPATGPTSGSNRGAADSRADGAHSEEDDDDDDGLAPDPHREILLRVGELRRDTQQIQASISSHAVQALWGDSGAIQRVAVRKLDMHNAEEREAICADFVEIAFRDQYVGRSDMWRLWRKLSQRVVHNNKATNMEGLIRASVRRIYKGSKEIACGYIDAMTQPIFRSESGRFIILLQMSEEMWAYHEDGNLCFEKAVNGFLAELFRRWNKSQLNHMVTIVMFSRWYYHGRDSLFYQDLTYDEETGRYYRDFYKVISDMEARPDWTVFLPELLAEFNAYRRDIQELTTASGNRLRGDLSKANQGNILEAINLGLNSFASNYVDRDLSRTGLSTVVVTPSFGVFDVPKRLLRMTTERMLHFGVRVDLVCLAPRPLFRPPVFRFKSYPVPSEQEQLRAQTLKEQAEQDAKRASESKLSSSSPLAESPGIHPVAGPFGPGGGGTALKDRTAKAAPKAAGLCSAIDPIMLDALYFDDEKWETELLPYLTGVTPRASHDSWVGKWHAAGVGGARANSAELEAVRQRQRQVESSIASAFVGSMANFSPAEVPDTILGLLKADHPYFAEVQPATDSKNRVVCCYFAYWVDSGFYNFADDRRSRHPGSFVPTCKMGDLSVAGIDNYMRCAPNIPALELRARDFGHAAGGDTYTGSASACSIGDPIYNRVEAGWPQDAQIAAAATNVAHGMILRTDQLASIEGHESLLAMFAAFDSQAIVGSGADHFVGSSGIEAMGSGSMWAGSGPLGAAGEHRTTYGHIPTPQHLVQTMAAANAPAVNRVPEPRSAATERGDTGPSRSAERPDRQLPGVSASASPKLRSSQDGKPGPPPERREPMSSSLPRDTRLAGSHQPSAAVQRTPGVSRASQLPPARRARLSRHPSSSAKPSVSPDPSHLAAAEQPSAVSGPSPTHDLPLGRAGGGSTPEAATRQSIPRRSESPHGLEYSRDSLGAAHYRPVGESMATQAPLSERMPVSESVTRQSHLDIQVRTFRGHGGHDFPAIQNVQSPNAVSMATQMALAMPRHYAPDASVGAIRPVGNFQLTLPDGRHGAAAPEHASGSPQFGKPTWLNDRLTASHGSEPPVRAPRGRYYGPFNPYNPDISQLPHNELSQRWALAFATHASLSSYTPKWRSLCTPASLPLVVNFIPHDLDSSYHHYQYQLQTSAATALEEVASQLPEDFGEFAQFMANHGWDSTGVARAMPAQQPDRMTHLMLRELVYQRLAQGYQLINVNEQVDARSSREMSVRFGDGAGRPGLGGRPETRAGPGGRSVMDPHLSSVSSFSGKLPLGSLKKRENAIWLSSGRQVQKLEIQDRSEAASSTEISVTRWERNRPFDMASLDYRFQMWSRIGNLGYSPSDTRFSYPGDDEVNWNSLDRLITGHHQELNHAMKYWRARYVLIPAEQLGNEVIFNAKTSPHLPVEDMRIANFEKFLEHILRLLRKEDREALERSFLEMVPPEMRRSDSSSASKRANGTQQRQPQQQPPPQQQQQQQQQPPQSQPQQPPTVPPPPLGHPASTGDCRKALGLGDLMPSSVMQIRYTTMYPVVYINNQLNAHMSDSIYLDPSQPIALPPPATSALGLSDHLNAESPFAHLAYALQHPAAGISLRNIRWHYGYFRSVFCGYQLVDWILVNFGSVTSRQQATTAGARLLERGVLRSPHRAQVFLDGYNFYELTEACQRLKTQSPAQGLRSQPTLMTSIGLADVVGKYSSSSNNASPNPSRPESRQGSAAPSVANDGELLSPGPPSSTVTGAAAGAAQPSRTSTPVGGGDAAGAQPAELRNSSNPQPASKLRVRTDIQPSALQSPSGSAAPEKGGPGLAQQAATGDSQPASGQPSTADAADAAEAAVAGQPPKYRRTADIFPESMRRASQRELPKVLGQTRMFALDLDQNHQSTRIEQCLVHLDAVHNPMSCFHLSINWLSCTNYLIEEMVRRWAQVAERCGMRLVEAPRAQDTSSEVNHPFHSPIKITLELPPPPVEDIFDAEWVAEMAHLGDSDSEPEPGLDSEARGVAADSARQEEARRARTLRRMARCLPTYPLERALLEEQDFVLDVEAETNYPPAALITREHTFERAEHEFTQYVHRSGTAFVQICGPGQFLWINNYLYASHQSYSRQPPSGPSAAQLAGEAAAAAAAVTVTGDAAGTSGVRPASNRAAPSSTVPVYYPARHVREVWPHQQIETFTRNRSPERQLVIPEMYSRKIVDELGRLPADFDSVNAAVTRIAVMQQAVGRAGSGRGDGRDTRVLSHGNRLRRGSIAASLPASDGVGEWDSEASAALAAASPAVPDTVPGDPVPDALRANFLEICKDKNSLEMFWQLAVRRYCNVWRTLQATQGPTCELPTNRPMTIDVLGDTLWQHRRTMPPAP